MKYILATTAFIAALFAFQSNAFGATAIDTIIIRPLLFNRHCLKSDAVNDSERKDIYDASAYARMQAWSSCPPDSFPDVDFSKYMLLYVFYTHSGCEYDIDQKMTCYVDHANKKVTLQVLIATKGICRPLYYKQEFFPIPLIPNNYSIELYTPDKKIPKIISAEN